jgi:hypothetical protein
LGEHHGGVVWPGASDQDQDRRLSVGELAGGWIVAAELVRLRLAQRRHQRREPAGTIVGTQHVRSARDPTAKHLATLVARE